MENKAVQLKPHLSPLSAWAFAIGTSVGWGSLVVTSNTYLAQAGPVGSVLGMILGTLVMLVIARNYAYMMQCYPEAGGAYSYSREAFGYDHGFLTAWFLALTYLAVLWANATSLPLFARYFIGGVFRVGRMYSLFGYDVYLGEALLSLAALAAAALVCAGFRRASAVAMTGLALVFTVGICLVFIGAIFQKDRSFAPAFVPDAGELGQIVKIAVISPWAFIGFENISHSSEELAFRRGGIFKVLVAAVISTSILYILITLLSMTAYPPAYGSWLEYIRDLGNLEGIEALPAFYAANYYLGGFGVTVLILSLLALILTSLIGNITALSRLFYALGKDRILPADFGALTDSGTPARAIMLIAAVSVIVPFMGRTAIGWIVDVTTIGATIIYGFVSAAARKLAVSRGDRAEKLTGSIGLAVMVIFLMYLLLPNFVSEGSMAKETYFLFIAWSVLGFLFFRSILHRDKARRFGKSIIVWVALLALVLFVALIWMRQSMISSNSQMLANVQAYYNHTDPNAIRLADEQFIEREMAKLESANTRTILMATGMFLFSLIIMLTNYTYMNKRTRESEAIANTDPMTGVKSKHAYLMREREINSRIEEGIAGAFTIVVCDVNGLKHINDTFGHKAGDDYIRAASRMICDLFQHSPVFRIGGDEFAVILSGRDYDSRGELLSRLDTISEENIGTDRVIVSAGCSEFDPGSDTAVHAIFERADASMYERKQALKAMGAKTR